MKKFLMAAMMFCGVLSVSAQSEGDFRFGVTGGMNVANVTDVENTECRIGFNLGGRVEYGITNNVYAGTGLLLSQKGFKSEGGDFKANPLYLQIPIHVGYHHDLGNTVSIFGETGPYLAFGIAGKSKYEESLDEFGEGGTIEVKEDYFGDKGANVFDFGWGLRFGVEVSKFQIHMGYEYGFVKVFDEGSNHNSNFNVGVSYFF